MDAMLKYVFRLAFISFLIGSLGLVYYFQKNQSLSPVMATIDDFRTVQEPVNALVLNTATADIAFTYSNLSEVTVRLVGEINEKARNQLKLDTQMTGSTLRISVEEPEFFGFSFGPQMHLQLQVTVPSKQYERIAIYTSTGDIHTSQVESSGCDIETATGDVSVEGFKGKQITVSSSTGDLKLREIQGNAALDSETGSVEMLEWTELTQDVTIETSTGDISIRARKTPPAAQLDLTSSTGEVTVDWTDLQYREKEEHRILATLGSGGPRVIARSSTGDISIQ
jgi:lia operon protein LiaG